MKIYAAALSLVTLGLAGFVIALWPADPAPAPRAQPPTEGEAAQAGGSPGRSVRGPPEAPAPRTPGTWM